jgi:hypothetical protein
MEDKHVIPIPATVLTEAQAHIDATNSLPAP